MDVDVAIVGGGPAGSTAGCLLKKYAPQLSVLILERDRFPRDHVGESQLPAISHVLDEMGCWDKVEAANFPIKIGATYKWGKQPELWDFDFMPVPFIQDRPRPDRFEGQRRFLAFQVDRAVYDDILLGHAAEMGCEVRQNAKVVRVETAGDRVLGLRTAEGEPIAARYTIDASGHSGIVRRALGIGVEYPTHLQNIAIWDYWRNARWAEEVGVGGTRVQVMSVGYGWLWFIPLGPERTSLGLVVPAEYYKASGQRPEALYAAAIQRDERIAGLLAGATSEGKLQTTKDWSFLASRHCGENWFLAGESGGFADPILAAGLTITHASAREAAFTILEIERGGDGAWLREAYDARQSRRIRNHIRFADYWYTSNGQFTDLQNHTADIARENGLDLDPQKAWAWLAQGGFIDEELGTGIAGFELPLLADLGDHLGGLREAADLGRYNVFRLDLAGASWREQPRCHEGRVSREAGYVRQGKVLPLQDAFAYWVEYLQRTRTYPDIERAIQAACDRWETEHQKTQMRLRLWSALDALILDGWVKSGYDPDVPVPERPGRIKTIHPHEETAAQTG